MYVWYYIIFYLNVKFDKEMCHDLIPLSIETPLLTVKQGINSALLLSILLSGFDFFLLKSLNPIRLKKVEGNKKIQSGSSITYAQKQQKH